MRFPIVCSRCTDFGQAAADDSPAGRRRGCSRRGSGTTRQWNKGC